MRPYLAEGIKAELERHTFADYMVPFEGAEAEKKQIDEIDVRFYLEMRMRIYVKEKTLHSMRETVFVKSA